VLCWCCFGVILLCFPAVFHAVLVLQQLYDSSVLVVPATFGVVFP